MSQIIYLSIENLQTPVGGVMVQAAHVEALVRAGYDAKISTTLKGARPDWLSPTVPIVDGNKFSVSKDDVAVLHDSIPRKHFERIVAMPLRKVFFCQNHYFLDQYLEPSERLSDFPIDAFICVSEPAAAYLRDVHGVTDPVVLRPCIMQKKVPEPAKKLQICYMPRKRLTEAGTVIYHLRYLHRDHAQIKFVSINNMHPDEVARIMAESAIFLSLSGNEGLGLPPLEAMRAGCVVIGYHGGGGLDYATPENGIWYDQATPDGLAGLVAEAIDRLKQDPGAYSDMITAGRETAALYQKDSMEAELLAFWRSFLGAEQ